MIEQTPHFKSFLSRFVPTDLQSKSSVIYGLESNYAISFLNSGWFQFAQRNGGEPLVSTKWGIGSNVLDAVPDGLRSFYKALYDRTLSLQWTPFRPVQHEYECSSKSKYRLFLMTLYPIEEINGVLVVNSLRISRPHEASIMSHHDQLETEYLNDDGVIRQCMCCRKVSHAKEEGRWDFIPEWVEQYYPQISHGLCGFCIHHYYQSMDLTPPSFEFPG